MPRLVSIRPCSTPLNAAVEDLEDDELSNRGVDQTRWARGSTNDRELDHDDPASRRSTHLLTCQPILPAPLPSRFVQGERIERELS